MLYKPGKATAKVTATPMEKQRQHQHRHKWHRLGHFLNAIGNLTLFGSHHNLASGGEVGDGGSGDRVEEKQHHQERHQQNQERHQQMRQHQQRRQQRQPPASAVSCQNLATLHQLADSSDEDQPGVNRVAKWATGLGHLLGDPDGVNVFTAYLREEFSEENIHFWLAVEDFKGLTDSTELLVAARRISRVHIGSEAPASVNLDCATVRDLQSRLLKEQPQPDCSLFNSAQGHIFNLMRLDSYARFLKSPLYQDCLLCELESRPLPTSPRARSLRHSEDSLIAPRPHQRQGLSPNAGRKQSRDFATDLPLTYRSRQPSFIVAALDLDCGFSVC